MFARQPDPWLGLAGKKIQNFRHRPLAGVRCLASRSSRKMGVKFDLSLVPPRLAGMGRPIIDLSLVPAFDLSLDLGP